MAQGRKHLNEGIFSFVGPFAIGGIAAKTPDGLHLVVVSETVRTDGRTSGALTEDETDHEDETRQKRGNPLIRERR